jgi:hypothetical protein
MLLRCNRAERVIIQWIELALAPVAVQILRRMGFGSPPTRNPGR